MPEKETLQRVKEDLDASTWLVRKTIGSED